MDAQLQTLVLQLLQQTADGLAAAIWAPIGEIETGGETAERFQARMDLSVQRLAVIRGIMQRGMVTPEELTAPLWQDHEAEREYQERPHTQAERELC